MAHQGYPYGAQTAYLLGTGPIPHPTPQHQAVAQMQTALDSGMFAHLPPSGPQGQANATIDPALLGMSVQANDAGLPGIRDAAAVRNITVDVPVYGTTENNKKKKAAPVLTRIIVPADLPPADFLSRMHAQMNVDPETAMLGWKEAQERRGDPYHRLSSEQDVKDAFRDLIKLQESTRLVLVVYISVLDE
ncbi:hypothetical protein R3P38DRAFT_3453254 [Favolaschia claudopus]|uniref:Uncharacterized protein n=1 Tax=Favolaschia claudopus TaxID=2862362 RepID=A0AAW0CMI4_9AGAR